MRIILATESSYKTSLFSRLKIPFESIASNVDEESFKKLRLSPQKLAELLAYEKALSVKNVPSSALVIGADQLVSFKKYILGKTGSYSKAKEQLKLLSGNTHLLINSFCILYKNKKKTATVVSKMTLRKLSSTEINRYLKAEEPYDCAGSYKIEKLGISLLKKIECSDPTAIEGLPLLKLSELLREFKIQIP